MSAPIPCVDHWPCCPCPHPRHEAPRQKPQCEVVVAEFVRWLQQCTNDAVGVVEVDGDEHWVCAKHGGVA